MRRLALSGFLILSLSILIYVFKDLIQITWVTPVAISIVITMFGYVYYHHSNNEEDLLSTIVAATAAFELLVYYNLLCYSCNILYGIFAGLLLGSQFAILRLIHQELKTSKDEKQLINTIWLTVPVGFVQLIAAILFIAKTSIVIAGSFVLMTIILGLSIIGLEKTYEYYRHNAHSIPKELLRKKITRYTLLSLILGLCGVAQYLIICGVA